jgi:hypothetical protein
MQNACKCCTIHPRQQATTVDSLGKRRQERGVIWGIEPHKRVKVELIEWRSIDLHSIDFKSTFCLPQSGKRMGTYSKCILGLRLRYWRRGEHDLKVLLEDKRIQCQSVSQKEGFDSCSFHFIFSLCSDRKILRQSTIEKISFCSFRWCSRFLLYLFFHGNIFFRKMYSIQ